MFLPKDRVEIAIPVSAFTGQESETCGRIAWTNELRKLEAVEFVELTKELSGKNNDWQAAVATDRAAQ
jgi:hypothetical protein